jgi:hypothetical protein
MYNHLVDPIHVIQSVADSLRGHGQGQKKAAHWIPPVSEKFESWAQELERAIHLLTESSPPIAEPEAPNES